MFEWRFVPLPLSAAFLLCCGSAGPSAPHLMTRTHPTMGSQVTVTAWTSDEAAAGPAVDAAFAEFDRLDAMLSVWKPGSDILRINAAAGRQAVPVSAETREVLSIARQVSEWTNGKFDVTFGALSDVWKFDHDRDNRVPGDAEIAARLPLIDYRAIAIDEAARTVSVARAGMRVHVGGIGKGYAVDRAIAVLKADGIRHALVNAGSSSIGTIGAPPNAAGWPVRLDVRVSDRDVLLLRDTSMSTSQQRLLPLAFASGAVGDIINPRTGAPTEQTTKVVVVMANGTAADALSTSLVLMSVDEARPLLDQFNDVSALWISPAGALQAAYHESRLQLQAP
jgi:FAD:protein FMN transferase